MGLRSELLKKIVDLKLKKATDDIKLQIQKLQQKVDDMKEKGED